MLARARDLGALAWGAASTLLGRAGPPGAVVLGYHGVHADASEYHVTPAAFRRQLEQVRRIGMEFTSLRELTDRLHDGRPVDGLAVVTFDDGFAELAGSALETLEDLAVPATVFVVTTDAGVSPRWWPGAPRTMSPDEVGALASSPMVDIESHTCTHRSLPSLSDDELADELRRSRSTLAEWTGGEVTLLAYPSGHHDERVRDAVRAAGYLGACTFRNGRTTSAVDPYRIPRLAMDARHGAIRWADHLARPPQRWPETQVGYEYADSSG